MSRAQEDERIYKLNAVATEDFTSSYLDPELLHYSSSHNLALDFQLELKRTNPVLEAEAKQHAITSTESKTCFDLVESTSRQAYVSSRQGWRPRAKHKEMRDKDMRFLLVHSLDENQKREFVGFLSFMLTFEDGYAVLYIYELHLVDAVRRHGLGKHLMTLAEAIATKTRMQKIMLTVFKSNTAACEWYFALGYVVDENSPRRKRLRSGTFESDYLILSKMVVADPENAG